MNTEDKTIHTDEKLAYIDAAQQLSSALHTFLNEHNKSPDQGGVRHKKDGSYEVFIDDGPVLWFQNENELSSWIQGMNNNG